MPELPEVETTRRGIEPAVSGQTLQQVIVRQPRLRWPVTPDLPRLITGQQVLGLRRRAKYLMLDLQRGSLIVHLGMSGSLRLMAARSTHILHDHVDIQLASGWWLRFNDPRRFGSVLWTADDPLQHPLLQTLGPEPLSDEFDAAYLYRMTRGRSVAIKQFIMNAHVVVGVGNIYASEALFRAGIRPRRAAGRLTRVQSAALVQAIKDVLTDAIADGGTTLRDYINPQGMPGYFKQRLFVYERAGEPCRVCGEPIRHLVQGQRSTYYCHTCQR